MLVLASSSPRRKQLMAVGGWDFSIIPGQVDEKILPNEDPTGYVTRLAIEKARLVARQLGREATKNTLVVAADTTVVIETFENNIQNVDALHQTDYSPNGLTGFKILGKPSDTIEAENMLRCLRGRVHHVYTGLALLRIRDNLLRSGIEKTSVFMHEYNDGEIQNYIATGDPMDKAGAYAIQNTQFQLVQNLQGCYANVMGLPVCRLSTMLSEFNVTTKNNILDSCQILIGVPCLFYLQALEM